MSEKEEYMIIVRRTYLPLPGTGGQLLTLVKQASDAMAEAGFERPTVLRGWHGMHGALQTEQVWQDIAAYEASRSVVRRTPGITSVFGEIYPLTGGDPHDRHLRDRGVMTG